MIRERNLYLGAARATAIGSILLFGMAAVTAAPLAQSENAISTGNADSHVSKTILLAQAGDDLLLDDGDPDGDRLTANKRVGQAVQFISMLPYTFAVEGR